MSPLIDLFVVEAVERGVVESAVLETEETGRVVGVGVI